MGSDDLFHKRKAKLQHDVTRRKASREPYQKVLVVCEGEKTEPIYFSNIKDYYEINSANIRITGDGPTDPLDIFNYAYQLYLEEKNKGDSFDRVYCVFDKDSFDKPPNTYQQALDKINAATPKGTFFAITSVPCFEYWFILHYVYTTAPYASAGSDSIGHRVFLKLKEYWPEYTKSMPNTFEFLLSQLDFAINNAVRSLAEASQNHTDNPSTHVHELVIYLQNIKRELA